MKATDSSVIGVSLSELHTSVVNDEFHCTCMHYRGGGGGAYVHLV